MSEQMKYSCPNCDSENTAIEKRPGGWCHCLDCHYSWQPYPVRFGFDVPPHKQTLFQRITESEETLADKLVYFDHEWLWYESTILEGETFKTRAEAFAATVAELKEVKDE